MAIRRHPGLDSETCGDGDPKIAGSKPPQTLSWGNQRLGLPDVEELWYELDWELFSNAK